MSLGASHALDASVLVLNKFFMAVHVIPVRRAFCLLLRSWRKSITLDDGRYQSFDFESWREVSEARAASENPMTNSSGPSISRSRSPASSAC